MVKNYLYTGLLDKHGTEVKVGDILKPRYGGKIIIEPLGSHIVGAFTYRPVGAVNEGSSYLLNDLKSDEIEIIDNTEKSEQQELVEDLVQIITVFSCKLQGKRANKARKLVKELIEEGGEENNDKNNSSNVIPK